MLKQIKNIPEDIFGIEMSGKVTKEELKKVDGQMSDFKKAHGKINFLAVVKDYDYASPEALWEDLKTGLKHFEHIEKAALVSDVDWAEDSVKAMNLVTPNLHMKTFGPKAKDEAIAWLERSKENEPKKVLKALRDEFSNAKKMKSQVIVVTGASGGVGRATAIEFAKQGASILLIARGQKGLEGAKTDVENHGGKAWTYQADVSDEEQVEAAADFAEREIGPIDVWVNNAMVSVFSRVMDMEPGEYKRVTDVTYLGQVFGTKAALKRMKKRNCGSIILVGSALAYRGIPLQSAYCGSKHAIQGFFESLRAELLHDRINVHLSIAHLPAMNTTQFGWVKSRFDKKPKPMGAIYEPEVAARAIVELAKTHERLRMVGLPTLKTVWGNKFLPGFLDHYMARHGFKGQLTDRPVDPNRKDNLWEPIEEDRGIHGDFGDSAAHISIYDEMVEHKRSLAYAGIGLVGAFLLGRLIRKIF